MPVTVPWSAILDDSISYSVEMKSTDIALHRLANQQISGGAIQTGCEMVRWFGAVQGQEYALSKWALGLRLPHLNDSDIEKDLNEEKILRIHLLRPTWHFISCLSIVQLRTARSPAAGKGR
jgi:hypothetical protein